MLPRASESGAEPQVLAGRAQRDAQAQRLSDLLADEVERFFGEDVQTSLLPHLTGLEETDGDFLERLAAECGYLVHLDKDWKLTS